MTNIKKFKLKVMQSIYISIIKKIKKHFPQGFCYQELEEKKILSGIEMEMVHIHLHNTLSNLRSGNLNFLVKDTLFVVLRPEGAEGQYYSFSPTTIKNNYKQSDQNQSPYVTIFFTLSLDSEFKFIDYEELSEARKYSRQANEHAQAANKHAMQAIAIAIGGILITVIATYFINTIKIDDTQFQQIITPQVSSD